MSAFHLFEVAAADRARASRTVASVDQPLDHDGYIRDIREDGSVWEARSNLNAREGRAWIERLLDHADRDWRTYMTYVDQSLPAAD